MKYAILIYEKPDAYTTAAPDDMARMMTAHQTFMANNGAALRGGEALQPVTTATKIVQDVVTDGPFVESKESLGGFYLIEAADLDAAIAIAKQVPAPFGGVEVRPIWDTGN